MNTLKLVGFSKQAETFFEAVLQIIESGLDENWCLVASDQDQADYQLFAPKVQPLLQNNDEASHCIICHRLSDSGALLPAGINHVVTVSNEYPSAYALRTTLNAISKQQAETATGCTKEKPEVFKPFGLVNWLLGDKPESFYACTLISDENRPPLYIDTTQGYYYHVDSLEVLQAYFNAAELKWHSLEAKDFKTCRDRHNLQQPSGKLSNLIWYGVYWTSKGRLWQGHQATTPVQLKRWPDLSLPGCQQAIGLFAYMQNNSVSLETVQAQTQFERDLVYRIYNACYALGLIEHCTQTEFNPVTLSDKKQALLQAINQRLENGVLTARQQFIA